MGMLRKAANAIVLIIEDGIERIGNPHGDEEVRSALRKACIRASELAIDKAELEDRVGVLEAKLNELGERAMSGQGLYSDEVEAISFAQAFMAGFAVDNANGDYSKNHTTALHNLLSRSEHLAMTELEFGTKLHGIITGVLDESDDDMIEPFRKMMDRALAEELMEEDDDVQF